MRGVRGATRNSDPSVKNLMLQIKKRDQRPQEGRVIILHHRSWERRGRVLQAIKIQAQRKT